MQIPEITLSSFLAGTNAQKDLTLPLVHSTQAANLIKIVNNNSLLATPCNVFVKDRLCYFFVGRPAYKQKSVEDPSEWELPVAFVVRFHEPPPFKRIFPFDSGAFKGKLLPRYITMFNLENYNVSGDPEHIGRIISVFFKTRQRYQQRRASGYEELAQEHLLGPEHQEIKALAKLYLEQSSIDLDDRAAAIEVQIDQDVKLSRENLLGIVVPEEYMRSPTYRGPLQSMANVIETYGLHPLSTAHHYGQIYDAVNRIYNRAGVPM